jgi:hypothetical protein
MCLSFPFILLNVSLLTQGIHCSETALHLAEETTLIFLCGLNSSIVREQGKMGSKYRWGILKYGLQYWGKDRTLRHNCRYVSWSRNFAFYQDFNFLLVRREATKLMTLFEKANSDNL